MKGKGGAHECNVACLVIVTRVLLGSWGKYSVCRLRNKYVMRFFLPLFYSLIPIVIPLLISILSFIKHGCLYELTLY